MSARLVRLVVAGWLGVMLPNIAAAGLITVDPGSGQVIDFSQFGGSTMSNGPTNVGGLVGESVIATGNGDGFFVGSANFGLGGNGNWNSGRNGFMGTPNSGGSGFFVDYFFSSGPVSTVGAFLNYSTPPLQAVEIAVYDAMNVLLETYNLTTLAPINTPAQTNAGAFRGISRLTSDISRFRVFADGGVIDNLTFSRAVPEPATWLLMTASVGLYGLRRWRRTPVASTSVDA